MVNYSLEKCTLQRFTALVIRNVFAHGYTEFDTLPLLYTLAITIEPRLVHVLPLLCLYMHGGTCTCTCKRMGNFLQKRTLVAMHSPD